MTKEQKNFYERSWITDLKTEDVKREGIVEGYEDSEYFYVLTKEPNTVYMISKSDESIRRGEVTPYLLTVMIGTDDGRIKELKPPYNL